MWLPPAVEVWVAEVVLEREVAAVGIEARPAQDRLDRAVNRGRQDRLDRLCNVGRPRQHRPGRFLQCQLADRRLGPRLRRLRHPQRAREPEA